MDRLGRPGRRADQIVVLLQSLGGLASDAGDVTELEHALQVAGFAEEAGADERLVLAALCHDLGKIVGDVGHGAVAAAILEPHVGDTYAAVVRHHQAFTARHWDPSLADDDPRLFFADQPWFRLAEHFVDAWDMRAFEPSRAHPPLEHFVPLIQHLATED